MEYKDRDVKTLQELGLTQLQARIYIVLIQTEKEKVHEISRIANIDRSSTYQVIEQLQKMGLVEKIIGKPTLYQALPLEKGIPILLNQQKKHYDKIKKSALELVQEYKTKNEPAHKGYIFKIVERRKQTEIEDVIEAHNKLKECIDVLINKNAFQECFINLSDLHIKILRRGVKYRLITEKANPKHFDKKFMDVLQEKNCQIRYITDFPKAEVVIRDKTAATVILVPGLGLGKKPALFTDHTGCIEICQNHFDKVWNTATKATKATTPNQ
ncbi:MAG: hypothetical protein NWF04_00230 [Candidatus Bathyarchaeota archaeon]|nr:hypothetical protein [Candidatus Bathyarchaeota archaeon]